MSGRLLKVWRRVLTYRIIGQNVGQAEEDCWAKVRAKAAVLPAAEVNAYVKLQAAGFAHRAVDELLRTRPYLDGRVASDAILRASERLTLRILRRLQSIHPAPRVAPKVAGRRSGSERVQV